MNYKEFDDWFYKVKLIANKTANLDEAVLDAYFDFFWELHETAEVGPRRAVDLFVERYI